MRTQYPLIQPNASHLLTVSHGHQLYVEECGNPKGIPAVFIHGGPGGGCRETDRCFFDSEKYRIILFDQRGCGRSLPHSSLDANNSDNLIADIEAIRHFLSIEKWLVFGGSWGSTLALLYSQAHAQRVSALILRGIFLCRQADIDWFYQQGANQLFPDYWQDYLQPIPESERHNMLAAYYRQLTGNNELERMAAAKAWSLWEGRCSTLKASSRYAKHFVNPHFALAMARIECHYFINQCFMADNQIIDNVQRLAGIPATIIHGRYDVVCPVAQAYALAAAWPEASLNIIGEAGHSSAEPAITDALIKATDGMANIVGKPE